MARWVKRPNGTLTEISNRFVKASDGTMHPVVKRYRKMADGTMQEVWPLVPGPVTGLDFTTPYQNDRIELVATWTAPTTGAAVADYLIHVDVYYPGTSDLYWQGDFVIAAPATSWTWQNIWSDGSGLQHVAGYNIHVIVTPRSVGPRAGQATTSATKVIAQLPAPDNVPTLNIDVQNYVMTESWTNMTGNRVTGYVMHIYHAGNGPYVYNFDKGTTSAGVYPWDAGTVAGGWVDVYIAATGPGGQSPAWTNVVGGLPQMPTIGNIRFYYGQLINDVSCPGYGCNTYWQNVNTNSAWTFIQVSGVGRVGVTGSEGWARDNSTYYRFIYVPINNLGWTGRAVGSGWALKLPLPHYIAPNYSETWYSERGWFGLPIKQGASTAGERTGCFFYGGQILSAFTPARTGYDFTVTTTKLMFGRTNNGGLGQAVPIRLWLHGWNDRPGGRPDLAGGADFAYVAKNTGGLYDIPEGWGNLLKAGQYAGTAIYFPNTGIIPGGVSAQYIEAFGHTSSGFGIVYGTLAFYHDA